jgi:nicotinate-nucleotide adenylyltransferase
VFFGGTFNPWHLGHQSCIDLLPDEKVCLILPDRNPQKELRQINPVTTVLEISSRAKFKRKQFLAPTFVQEETKNPTIHWVREFKKNYPQDKISFLMGFDSFLGLDTWIQSEELLNLIDSIYVVSRLETESQRTESLEKNARLNPKLEITFLGRHDYEDLSSTEIRKKNGRT